MFVFFSPDSEDDRRIRIPPIRSRVNTTPDTPPEPEETKPSPVNQQVRQNRLSFFSAPAEPFRIDPFAFLGLRSPNKPTEPKPAEPEPSKEEEDEVSDASQDTTASQDTVDTVETAPDKEREDIKDEEKDVTSETESSEEDETITEGSESESELAEGPAIKHPIPTIEIEEVDAGPVLSEEEVQDVQKDTDVSAEQVPAPASKSSSEEPDRPTTDEQGMSSDVFTEDEIRKDEEYASCNEAVPSSQPPKESDVSNVPEVEEDSKPKEVPESLPLIDENGSKAEAAAEVQAPKPPTPPPMARTESLETIEIESPTEMPSDTEPGKSLLGAVDIDESTDSSSTEEEPEVQTGSTESTESTPEVQPKPHTESTESTPDEESEVQADVKELAHETGPSSVEESSSLSDSPVEIEPVISEPSESKITSDSIAPTPTSEQELVTSAELVSVTPLPEEELSDSTELISVTPAERKEEVKTPGSEEEDVSPELDAAALDIVDVGKELSVESDLVELTKSDLSDNKSSPVAVDLTSSNEPVDVSKELDLLKQDAEEIQPSVDVAMESEPPCVLSSEPITEAQPESLVLTRKESPMEIQTEEDVMKEGFVMVENEPSHPESPQMASEQTDLMDTLLAAELEFMDATDSAEPAAPTSAEPMTADPVEEVKPVSDTPLQAPCDSPVKTALGAPSKEPVVEPDLPSNESVAKTDALSEEPMTETTPPSKESMADTDAPSKGTISETGYLYPQGATIPLINTSEENSAESADDVNTEPDAPSKKPMADTEVPSKEPIAVTGVPSKEPMADTDTPSKDAVSETGYLYPQGATIPLINTSQEICVESPDDVSTDKDVSTEGASSSHQTSDKDVSSTADSMSLDSSVGRPHPLAARGPRAALLADIASSSDETSYGNELSAEESSHHETCFDQESMHTKSSIDSTNENITVQSPPSPILPPAATTGDTHSLVSAESSASDINKPSDSTEDLSSEVSEPERPFDVMVNSQVKSDHTAGIPLIESQDDSMDEKPSDKDSALETSFETVQSRPSIKSSTLPAKMPTHSPIVTMAAPMAESSPAAQRQQAALHRIDKLMESFKAGGSDTEGSLPGSEAISIEDLDGSDLGVMEDITGEFAEESETMGPIVEVT